VCTISRLAHPVVDLLVQLGLSVAAVASRDVHPGVHEGPDLHEPVYHRVREAAAAAGRPVAVLVDLQGPKIRLGTFVDGKHELEVGDTFTITTEDVPGTKELVSTTHKGLPGDARVGD